MGEGRQAAGEVRQGRVRVRVQKEPRDKAGQEERR